MFGVYLICRFRKKLFNLINDVPTVLDVVTGKKSLGQSLSSAKVKDATTVISHKSNGKANSSTIKVVKMKKIKKFRCSHPLFCSCYFCTNHDKHCLVALLFVPFVFFRSQLKPHSQLHQYIVETMMKMMLQMRMMPMPMKMKRILTKEMKMSMKVPYVAYVANAMALTSFGFVAIFARGGSTVNV
jgi:hypothetical protein